jgi:hypothetical protein
VPCKLADRVADLVVLADFAGPVIFACVVEWDIVERCVLVALTGGVVSPAAPCAKTNADAPKIAAITPTPQPARGRTLILVTSHLGIATRHANRSPLSKPSRHKKSAPHHQRE